MSARAASVSTPKGILHLSKAPGRRNDNVSSLSNRTQQWLTVSADRMICLLAIPALGKLREDCKLVQDSGPILFCFTLFFLSYWGLCLFWFLLFIYLRERKNMKSGGEEDLRVVGGREYGQNIWKIKKKWKQ